MINILDNTPNQPPKFRKKIEMPHVERTALIVKLSLKLHHRIIWR